MKKILLTQDKVALVDDEDFEYLSQFMWNFSGKYACRNMRVGEERKTVFMHNVILITPIGLFIDHKNQDKLDNRRQNLRICTRSQNQANKKSPYTESSSKYRGVSWQARYSKWLAQIKCNRESICIGFFSGEKEAAFAYNNKAQELFGEFAYLNIL